MVEEEEVRIESRIAPPPLSCPKCEELLPPDLGELNCLMCDAKVNVEHAVTRRKWEEEKITCPGCEKVLVVGVDSRPANIQCGSCDQAFIVHPNIPKVEVTCPGCQRQLRMKRKPGKRNIDCPACDTQFSVKF
tara:strand:+ start:2733 stop:3131 length:399 start_codon:yes stop_codon:yes gene_type:complete